ncbi:MAG: formate/nitrite transporter family protein [Lachnospiraceae bacterium]|nr:formate/nitrite transporter family protein [Lachnospiraceae bacterium]MDD3797011.1 formate/nitrite transporter family protein [Lachnospiraceae bacterium]
MYESDITAVSTTAKNKANFMEKNMLGFCLMSCMAGMYIALGSILMGVVGGVFSGGGAFCTKLICGIVFSVGLCMVMMAGSELFTGNNFVMAVGGFTKTVSWGKIAKYWAICWVFNLVGSVVAALLFTMTGIPGSGDIGAFCSSSAVAKMSGTPVNLFAKAILCNICVCVAIWCGTRLKSEGAKMAMCFCCVTTFVTCGFEHSIANMTFLSIGLLNPNGAAVSLGGMVYNLAIVTLGNMVGGIIFVALPYYLTGKAKQK